jgi:hypothetical protein
MGSDGLECLARDVGGESDVTNHVILRGRAIRCRKARRARSALARALDRGCARC